MGASYDNRPEKKMVVTENFIMLRERQPEDESFLRHCFEATRGAEFASLTAIVRDTVLTQQRAAFEHAIANTPNARDRVAVLVDVPVGRVVETHGPGDWCLVDIAFLPDAQGRGLGTQVLRRMLTEAREAGVGVRLHVRVGHRALGWYQRHGFVEVGRTPLDVALRAE